MWKLPWDYAWGIPVFRSHTRPVAEEGMSREEREDQFVALGLSLGVGLSQLRELLDGADNRRHQEDRP